MTGPFGGDVTALTIDPREADRIWLGTSDGQLFRSTDGGNIWRRIRPGIKAPGFAITVILFDREKPGVIYAGMKPQLDLNDEANGGGVFISENDGESWSMLEGMRGRSVRNMTQSVKSPDVLAAAARDGIYYTRDRGQTWERITPANDPELKGFHSVAIDPRDADMIYVGTHHLPWKTTDAGKTWKLAGSKEKGMIDDSDIFAIHIDESNPDTVLMSACSGIYRSRDASATWTKIQGIPYTSRRTHVIYQHPTKPEMIFAGTTEGLWLSTDNGKPESWRRMTSLRMVINSIAIHPARPDRVFLGTDDNGVLISVDGGEGYDASNAGFINRQVRVVVADKAERGRVYAGVIYDSANGGLFISVDGGLTWSQSINGMGARDVYSLYQSDSNPATIYAGTNHGLVRSDD
ncbi:MAG: WD40/YVTN/BNR-like repeat-containing protein, partial [Blastocatellia bacterium]